MCFNKPIFDCLQNIAHFESKLIIMGQSFQTDFHEIIYFCLKIINSHCGENMDMINEFWTGKMTSHANMDILSNALNYFTQKISLHFAFFFSLSFRCRKKSEF